MTIALRPELEDRLRSLADRQSTSVDQLVERVLSDYAHAMDEHRPWIDTAEADLARVWPADDFSDWRKPDA